MSKIAQVYLGKGMDYPVSLTVGGAGKLVAGKEVIQNSIVSILSTPQGTRFYNPDYGSRLHSALFEPNDLVQKSLLRTLSFEALNKWEKRVRFVDITVKNTIDIAWIVVKGVILQSNEIESFIFPFYKKLTY